MLLLILPLSLGLTLQLKAKQHQDIIKVSNLQTDGDYQKQNNAVILLYVSAPECPYCKKLEKEVLTPLTKSNDYTDKVILREITWRSSESIINFKGQADTPRNLLKSYDIKVTPTLLFLDAYGKELSPSIVGYSSNEFFWYYLDAAIRKSNIKLESTSK